MAKEKKMRLMVLETLNGYGNVSVQEETGPWLSPPDFNKDEATYDWRPVAYVRYTGKTPKSKPQGASIEGDWFEGPEDFEFHQKVCGIVEDLLKGRDPKRVAEKNFIPAFRYDYGESDLDEVTVEQIA